MTTPTFSGEVQLRRWSESSTQGVQVTFALADSADLEPLKAKSGKRFMAVLVEIGDDELPVEPVKPARKDTRGPLCREACDLCEMPDFWAWINNAYPEHIQSEGEAKEWLCVALDIGSRKHLDEMPNAADRFISNIRIPFIRWQRSRRTA
jgi:hypothetical protein